jgi:hypothetical protein
MITGKVNVISGNLIKNIFLYMNSTNERIIIFQFIHSTHNVYYKPTETDISWLILY